MIILNLGCGTKTSSDPNVVNIDWNITLRFRKNKFLYLFAPIFFNGERLKRLRGMPDNIRVHNLAKGIPFPDNSVDVVFHSHMLEHLDRNVATDFLGEVKRVLKPGGVQRIVVPDLEQACRDYVGHISQCEENPTEREVHEGYIEKFLDQCVRREAFGTSQQAPFRRFVENMILGDARKRGETHQWMYDRITLSKTLEEAGFGQVAVHSYNTSGIPDWNEYGLDTDAMGDPHKGWSLYIEAVK